MVGLKIKSNQIRGGRWTGYRTLLHQWTEPSQHEEVEAVIRQYSLYPAIWEQYMESGHHTSQKF